MYDREARKNETLPVRKKSQRHQSQLRGKLMFSSVVIMILEENRTVITLQLLDANDHVRLTVTSPGSSLTRNLKRAKPSNQQKR